MRKRMLLLTLFLAACGGQIDDPTDDTHSTEEAVTTLGLVQFYDTLPALLLEQGIAQVMTTPQQYQSIVGHPAPGVDWTRQSVVLYAAGRANQTSTPMVTMRRDATRTTFVARLASPGTGCLTVTIPGASPPYFMAKFARATTTALDYYWDHTIYPCSSGPIDLSCAVKRCTGSNVCRLVDGRATCVYPPATCDYVECPTGSACTVVYDRARCDLVVSFPEGPSVSFPTASPFDLNQDGLVVSFPTTPPPASACALIRCPGTSVCARATGRCIPAPTTCSTVACRPGYRCIVSSGRAQCLVGASTTPAGPYN